MISTIIIALAAAITAAIAVLKYFSWKEEHERRGPMEEIKLGHEVNELERREEKRLSADVSVEIGTRYHTDRKGRRRERRTIEVSNGGPATAYDLALSVIEPEEGLRQLTEQTEAVLPREEFRPGDRVAFEIAIHSDVPSTLTLLATWEDGAGPQRRPVKVRLLK